MFVKNGLLEEFCETSRSAKYLTRIPIIWDDKKGCIKYDPFSFKVCLLVTGFFFGASCLHIIEQKLGIIQSTDLVLNISLMLAALFGSVFHMNWTIYRNENAENGIIRGIISFERDHCQNGKKIMEDHKKKLGRTCQATRMLRIEAGCWTPITLSFCAAFLLSDLPMNVLSYSPGKEIVDLMEYISTIAGIPSWMNWVVVKLVIYGVNWYVWAVGFRYGIIFANQVMLLSSTLSAYVSVFNRKFDTGTSSKTRSISELEDRWRSNFRIYREIQILSGYFNEIHKFPLITMLLTVMQGQMVATLGILNDTDNSSGVNLTKNSTAFKIFVKGYYVETLTISGIVMDVLFGYCGELHNSSKECLERLHHHQLLYKSKECRRTLKSLGQVKVLFGNDNFIEKITPVNYQQFSTDRIVDALLLSRPSN